VLGLATSDQGLDPACAEEPAVLVVVVAAVSDDAGGAPARTTGQAGDGGHRLEQRDQLSDVVAVAAGERPGERDPVRVD
jgi:phosphatidylserine synthase